MAISGFERSDLWVIKRLFADQLNAEIDFPEAEDIIWQLNPNGNHNYKLVTSDYWIIKADFLFMDLEEEAGVYLKEGS